MRDADNWRCTWGTDENSTCLSYTDAIATAITYKNGITSTATLTNGHNGHTHDAATDAVSNKGTAAPSGTSGWFLPSLGQWNLIVQGLATKKAGSAVTTDLTTSNNDTYKSSNLNSVITSAGGTGFVSFSYWSSSEHGNGDAWYISFNDGKANGIWKSNTYCVRSALAF